MYGQQNAKKNVLHVSLSFTELLVLITSFHPLNNYEIFNKVYYGIQNSQPMGLRVSQVKHFTLSFRL